MDAWMYPHAFTDIGQGEPCCHTFITLTRVGWAPISCLSQICSTSGQLPRSFQHLESLSHARPRFPSFPLSLDFTMVYTAVESISFLPISFCHSSLCPINLPLSLFHDHLLHCHWPVLIPQNRSFPTQNSAQSVLLRNSHYSTCCIFKSWD